MKHPHLKIVRYGIDEFRNSLGPHVVGQRLKSSLFVGDEWVDQAYSRL